MCKIYRVFIFILTFIAISSSVNAASNNEQFLEKRAQILDDINGFKQEIKDNYIEWRSLDKEKRKIADSYHSDLTSWYDFLWDKGCMDYEVDESSVKTALNDIKIGIINNKKNESNYLIVAKYILKLRYRKINLESFFENYNYTSLNKYDKESISSEVNNICESNVRNAIKDFNLKKPKIPDYSYYDSERKILSDRVKELNANIEKLYAKLHDLSEEFDKTTRRRSGSVTFGSDGTTYRTFDIER
jgi:hypothetical protein